MQIVSEQNIFDGVGLSMQGGRLENQDDMGCLETPLGFLIVVCDGMGGGPGGKTASYIVKQMVLDTFASCSPQSTPEDVFKLAVNNAQEALEEKMKVMPELKGMGSTLVAILIDQKSATVAHLGDSRCYKIKKDGRMAFRTADHSLVAELVKNKAITEEQARTSPQSNIITRGLGSTSNHVAQIDTGIAYERGDRFVLCTDGVWGAMTHAELLMRLGSRKDVPTLVGDLSKEIDQIGSSHGGHHDNHTLVVIEMRKNSLKRENMNKQTKLLLSLAGVLLLCSVIFNIVSASKVAKMAVLQQTIEVITDSCKVLNEANDSQVDTIQSLQSKIEDLQVAIGASGNKLKQKINDLANEKESLNTEINELRREIETLRYEINTLKKKSATPAAKTPAPNVKKDDKPTKTATAKQYIEQAVNSLEGLRNIKNKDEKKAPIEVEKYRKDAIRALKSFNEKTKKYERDVNEMIKCLETSNLFNPSKNVIGAPDKSFVVKKDTQDKVKEFVNKLNDIKKKL